jgi:hypothetical protein
MVVQDIMEQAQKGSEWLVQNQNPDGGWSGLPEAKVNGFYKAPWAFMEMGQPAAANRTLNYIKRRFLTGEGDLLPRNPSFHYLYCNAYVIIGASLAGRYDISIPTCRFLLSQQNEDNGGFNSQLRVPGAKSLSDTMSAGAAGIACLAAGQLGAARRAGDYLARITAMQPASKDRFFTTITAEGRLYTDIKDKEDDAFFRVVETNKADQCWYAVGLPFAFLVQLTEATNENPYRDLAGWYFDFQSCCVGPWEGYSSGKAGWGCAMLYRITGEKTYREIALHVAEKIISRQKLDGSWSASDKPTEAEMDLTAEFTLWLSLISTNILARDECRIPVRVKQKWLPRFEKGQGFRGLVKSFHKNTMLRK